MAGHEDEEDPQHNRMHVKSLLKRRLKDLHRQEARLHDSPLKSFYASQEAILGEVLRRANGHQDDETLLHIIDVSILESRCHQKITTDRGLKSFFGIKVRVLRAVRIFIRKYFRPRTWGGRKKK